MDTTVFTGSGEADREADGFMRGLAVGVVTDNKDLKKLARVRVRLPWHTGSDTSYWARLALPMAGPDRGTYFVPEVGDEVVVGAENGDLSHLYVLGMVWNGQQPPPADNGDGANNTRLIKSRSGHMVRFNDDEAAPEVEVALADGKKLAVHKDGITLTDGQGDTLTFTSNSGAIEISASQELTLRAPKVSIEATAAMEVKASGTLTLKGAMVQIN
jgi:uncharacterized protein involved in type VI secretion and phage assembly